MRSASTTWVQHVAHVCKKMAYYLYLIGYYQKVLPDNVIKMLIDSLVASHLVYALSVWGPSLSVGLLHRITQLHNRGVRMIFGLRKYDHV